MAPNYISKVAIVGATGNVGKPILKALLETGKHSITALTRADSKTATAPLPGGVRVAAVPSYDDEEAVTAALRGVEALVISLAVTAPPATQTHLINAAVAAGVGYVVPNQWGVDPTNVKVREDTMLGAGVVSAREDVARANAKSNNGSSSTKLVFVACGFWYEFSLAGGTDRYGFDLEKRTLRLMDGGNARISTSTWPQTGRAVARLLSLPILPTTTTTAAGKEELTISGIAASESATVFVSSFHAGQRDMFESVKRVTATTDADWTVDDACGAEETYEAARRAVFGGDHSAFTRMLYSRVFFPAGDASIEHKKMNAALGLPEEDLDEATREAVRMAENHEGPP